MTKEEMKELILSENSVVIAKENNKVIAFVMAASWEYWSKWPIFEFMKNKLPEFYLDGVRLSEKNSYQYGPVCVDKAFRGTGVFEKIFYASLKLMHDKYPILTTFVNKINHRSHAAHTKKANLVNVGEFQFNDNNYYLMARMTNNYKIKMMQENLKADTGN